MNKKQKSNEANSGQVSLQSRNGERQSCPGGNTANQGEENHLDNWT